MIEEPNHTMAFDIVGPFPRSKEGFKYVLTAICLHSKFPEAIALKDIKAETVAEGMTTIFCRTGIPKQILTDQGTQFLGHIVQQLCGVHHLKTAPYYPQTNGCLERWHGTLVPIIKKNLESKLDWLFACRSAQNRNTG